MNVNKQVNGKESRYALERLACIYVFLPKTKYECYEAGLLAQPITFHLPIFGQWYIEMRLQALQLREQPPFFTGFPFNSS
jgi:hypothetical protein